MAKNIVLFSQFQAQRETVVFHALKVVVVGSVFSRIETAVAQIFLFISSTKMLSWFLEMYSHQGVPRKSKTN